MDFNNCLELNCLVSQRVPVRISYMVKLQVNEKRIRTNRVDSKSHFSESFLAMEPPLVSRQSTSKVADRPGHFVC